MVDNGLTWTTEKRKLSDLQPQEDNPRQIREKQVERLVTSWTDYGQVETLAVGPNGEIYNGHQRYHVMLDKFGPDYEMVCRVSSRSLTHKEWQRLTVLLHEGATGEWNFDELANWDVDVGELVEWGFTEEKLGLAGWDFDDEPAAAPEAQVDRAAELQEKWQVEVDQVWQAGEHFVTCGDCREAETWERLLAMAKVDKVNGVFTSPPYAEQRKKQYGGVPIDQYVEWWEAVQENVKANLASDGSFFVNIKPHCKDGERVLYVFDLVMVMRRRWGWRFVDELCWAHPGVPGRWTTRFKNGFEPIYHFSFGNAKFHPDNCATDSKRAFKGDGSTHIGKKGGWLIGDVSEGKALPSNVLYLNVENLAGAGVHVAVFPVALPDFFVRAYSDPDDIWLDPFLGSGTTICAAHQNQRRGLGIEILPRYVSVTLERLADMGLEPRLAE